MTLVSLAVTLQESVTTFTIPQKTVVVAFFGIRFGFTDRFSFEKGPGVGVWHVERPVEQNCGAVHEVVVIVGVQDASVWVSLIVRGSTQV
jgi:hypothetical protein